MYIYICIYILTYSICLDFGLFLVDFWHQFWLHFGSQIDSNSIKFHANSMTPERAKRAEVRSRIHVFICIQMLADTQKNSHMNLGTKTYKEQPLSNYTDLYKYQFAITCMNTKRYTSGNSARLHALPLLTRFPFIC